MERPSPTGRGSVIRVWKLGSLEHSILPTQEAVQRLADILSNMPASGGTDIIWGPDIDVQLFERHEGDIDVIAVDPRFVIVGTDKGVEIKMAEE